MDTMTQSLNITTMLPSRAPRSSDIAFTSSVILTVLTGSLFVSACVVLNGYYWKRVGRALVETRIGIVVFFLGALLSTITTLGCYKDIEIYGIYSLFTTPTDNEFVMKLFGKGFFIVKAAYNALIIDYRLLCCLLFLEHALELEDTRHSHIEIQYDPLDEPQHGDRFQASTSVNVEVAHYSGYGYIIGVACVGLQLVNGLQYLDFVGVWSNVFPIMADIMVVLFGLIMISGNPAQDNGDGKWRDTESKAIDVMVGFMGAVGFVYWVMKACFCFLWSFNSNTNPVEESSHPYFIWTAIKDAARSIGMLFQMYFFMKMGPNYCTQARNISRKIHHLLVPAMMLTLLSIFLGCVIDQYNGKVEHLIKNSNIDPALLGFFEGAAPIHLGFTLHMFLHFYIMKRKMTTNQQQQNVSILPVADHSTDGCDDGERREQPLPSSSEDQSFASSA